MAYGNLYVNVFRIKITLINQIASLHYDDIIICLYGEHELDYSIWYYYQCSEFQEL